MTGSNWDACKLGVPIERNPFAWGQLPTSQTGDPGKRSILAIFLFKISELAEGSPQLIQGAMMPESGIRLPNPAINPPEIPAGLVPLPLF
jgi:hypothetical protein